MGLPLEPSGRQNPRALYEGGRQLLELFCDSHTIATAERTKSLLSDVPPQGGSCTVFSKISLFFSGIVTIKPSRRILAITPDDLEISIAIQRYDLRSMAHVVPQEKWMTWHDVSVPR